MTNQFLESILLISIPTFGRTSNVCVFDTKDKGGVGTRVIQLSLFRHKPIVQSCSGPSYMQTSSRTGCKSHARRFVFRLFAFQRKLLWQGGGNCLSRNVRRQHKESLVEVRIGTCGPLQILHVFNTRSTTWLLASTS